VEGGGTCDTGEWHCYSQYEKMKKLVSCTWDWSSYSSCSPGEVCVKEGSSDAYCCTVALNCQDHYDNDECGTGLSNGCQNSLNCTSPGTGKCCGGSGVEDILDCDYYYNLYQCGEDLGAGCGNTIDCTECNSGYSCNIGSGTCTTDPCPSPYTCSYWYSMTSCGERPDGCDGTITCMNPPDDMGHSRCCNTSAGIENGYIYWERNCDYSGYQEKCGTGLNDGCNNNVLDCGCDSGYDCSTSSPGELGECVDEEELECEEDEDCESGWHCNTSTEKCEAPLDCGEIPNDSCGSGAQAGQYCDNGTLKPKCSSECSNECPSGYSCITEDDACHKDCAGGANGAKHGDCILENAVAGLVCSDGSAEKDCEGSCGGVCGLFSQVWDGERCECVPPGCEDDVEEEAPACVYCLGGTEFETPKGKCIPPESGYRGMVCNGFEDMDDYCQTCPCGDDYHCKDGACVANCDEAAWTCSEDGDKAIRKNKDCEIVESNNCGGNGCTGDGRCGCAGGTAHGEHNDDCYVCEDGSFSEEKNCTECECPEVEACSDGTPEGDCSVFQPPKYCKKTMGMLMLVVKCSECEQYCPPQTHCKWPTGCVDDCEEEWVCTSGNTKRAYQQSNCDLTSKTTCTNGCEGGQCLMETCVPKTCDAMEWECGEGIENHCGKELECGETDEFHYCSQDHKRKKKPDAEICIQESLQWECGTGTVGELSVNCGGCGQNEECNDNTHKCETTLSCSDGTAYGLCSDSKPGKCEFGVLLSKCSECGCPQGEECMPDESCAKTANSCSDGTPYGACSDEKPVFCSSYGILEDNCTKCGCLAGNTCDAATGECFEAEPDDCGLLEHGKCQESFKPVHCSNGTLEMDCTKCGCDTGLNCNYSSKNCQRGKTARIVLLPAGAKKECGRRETCRAEFQLRDSMEKRVEAAGGKMPVVVLGGKELEVKKTGSGDFYVEIEPGYRPFESAQLSFSAIAKLEEEFEIDQNVEVFFKKEEISLNWFFKKALHQGEKIGKFSLKANYKGGGQLADGNLSAELKAAGVSIKKKLEWNNGTMECGFDHAITLEDATESPRIEIRGTDAFGNRIEKAIIVPTAEGKNPEFSLEVSEIESLYEYGVTIRLEARVNSRQGDTLSGTRVHLKSIALGIDRDLEFDSASQSYTAEILMPDIKAEKPQVDLAVTGSASLLGEEIVYAEKKLVALTKNIGIEFLYPLEGISLTESGSIESLAVELTIEPGRVISAESVRALLFVDGKSQSVELLKEGNRHTAMLKEKIPLGEHLIELELAGGYTGSRKISTTILPSLPVPVLLGLAGALIVLALVLYYSRGLFLERHALSEKQKAEIIKRRRKLKTLKLDYYKRVIPEEEYKDKALKIQAEIKELKKKTPKRKRPASAEEKSMMLDVDRKVKEIKRERKKGGKKGVKGK